MTSVSIVVPTLNEPRLVEAVRSLRRQDSAVDLQVIIIDGGSSGVGRDALEAAAPHADICVSEPDRGVYDAMNKGFRVAKGDVVGTLSANDRHADAHVLADVLAAVEGGADAAYGDLVYEDASGRARRVWRAGAYKPWKFNLGWMPPHPTFFVRRKVVERLGGFNLRYRIAADYELMLRYLRREKVRPVYVPRPLVRMSLGGLSNRSLTNVARANKEVRQAWRENALAGGTLAPILKPARKAFQYLRSDPARLAQEKVRQASATMRQP